MVSSQQCNFIGVPDFEAHEVFKSLNRIVTSVDEVPDKNIVRIWDLTTLIEEFKDIEKLPMDVTANDNWAINWVNIGFLDEDLLHLLTNHP